MLNNAKLTIHTSKMSVEVAGGASGASTSITKIQDLQPFCQSWTVRGYVNLVEAGGLQPYKNANGAGVRFSFRVQDRSGEVRCTLFGIDAEAASRNIRVGLPILLQNWIFGQKRTASGEYKFDFTFRKGVSVCELEPVVHVDSSIHASSPVCTTSSVPIPLQESVHAHQPIVSKPGRNEAPVASNRSFSTVEQCKSQPVGSKVNVAALIRKVEETCSKTTKAGRSVKLRELVLYDESGELCVTLWFGVADAHYTEGSVICLENAEIQLYNYEKRLYSSGPVLQNVASDEVTRLQQWKAQQDEQRLKEEERRQEAERRRLQRLQEQEQERQERLKMASEEEEQQRELQRQRREQQMEVARRQYEQQMEEQRRREEQHKAELQKITEESVRRVRLCKQTEQISAEEEKQIVAWETRKQIEEKRLNLATRGSKFTGTILTIAKLDKAWVQQFCGGCYNELTTRSACPDTSCITSRFRIRPLKSYSLTVYVSNETESKQVKLSDGFVASLLGPASMSNLAVKPPSTSSDLRDFLRSLRVFLQPLLWITREFVIVDNVAYVE